MIVGADEGLERHGQWQSQRLPEDLIALGTRVSRKVRDVSESVAQNPIMPVSPGMKKDQNCPAFG